MAALDDLDAGCAERIKVRPGGSCVCGLTAQGAGIAFHVHSQTRPKTAMRTASAQSAKMSPLMRLE